MSDAIMTYDAAEKWLEARLTMPTLRSARNEDGEEGKKPKAGLEALEGALRNSSFFSARTAEEHILNRIRAVADAYSKGEIALAEARKELKDFLGQQIDRATGAYYIPDDPVAKPPYGISEDEWKEAHKLRNLASTSRLNLIFNTAAAQARAVGEWQVVHDPELVEVFPFVRYISAMSDTSRPAHMALNGKVFKVDDPFLQTHWPGAWDFNCKCYYEQVDADTVEAEGVEVEPPGEASEDAPTGYSFDPSLAFVGADVSQVKNRAQMLDDIRKVVKRTGQGFVCRPVGKPLAEAPLRLDLTKEEFSAKVDAWREDRKSVQPFQLGTLSDEMCDAMAIPRGAEIIVETKGTASGFGHMIVNHDEALFDGTAGDILQELTTRKDVTCSLKIQGKNDHLNITFPGSNKMITLRDVGNGKWALTSANADDEEWYLDKVSAVK